MLKLRVFDSVRKRWGWRNLDDIGGSPPEGVLQSKEFTFVEEATSGVYTKTWPIPAGSVIADILLILGTSWACFDSLGIDTILDVGDEESPQGYYDTVGVHGAISVYSRDGVTPAKYGTLHLQGASGSGKYGRGGILSTAGSNVNANTAGPGARYATDNVLTMTLTVNSDPGFPAVPIGELTIVIWYFTPVSPSVATFV